MPIKVLLVCSSGASSGFIAKNVRDAAKARNVDLDLSARSDSAIDDYIDEIDLLLIAPHLTFMLDDLKPLVEEHHVKMAVVPKEAYGSMDGDAILDCILKTVNK